jgi:hypothetical protein
MAKKAVATLRDKTAGKGVVKCIRMTRSERTGAYMFKEEIIPTDNKKNFSRKKLPVPDMNERRNTMRLFLYICILYAPHEQRNSR